MVYRPWASVMASAPDVPSVRVALTGSVNGGVPWESSTVPVIDPEGLGSSPSEKASITPARTPATKQRATMV